MAHQVTVVSPQPMVSGPVTTVIVQKKEPNPCRNAIPAMHVAMAITCLILNIFLPGIGTIVAGFAVFCCGNPGQSGGGKFGTFCINFWIGLAQLVLAYWIIGWIWAIIWGVFMLSLSDEYHNPQNETSVITTAAPAPQQMIITTSAMQQQQQGFAQPPQVLPPPPQYASHPPEFVMPGETSACPPPYAGHGPGPSTMPTEKC